MSGEVVSRSAVNTPWAVLSGPPGSTILRNLPLFPSWLALIVSWMVGPFVRCPYCGQWGASLEADPERARSFWRCRVCGHSRRRRSYSRSRRYARRHV